MKVKAHLIVEIKKITEDGFEINSELLMQSVRKDLERIGSYIVGDIKYLSNLLETTLLIEIETEFENDINNDSETLRYCVEDDLEDIGVYFVGDVTVVANTEKIIYT